MSEYQNADGTPHVTYYDQEHLLSFVWDGTSDHIDVSHGGYGEPVVDTIPVPYLDGAAYAAADLLRLFKNLCDEYVEREGVRYETA